MKRKTSRTSKVLIAVFAFIVFCGMLSNIVAQPEYAWRTIYGSFMLAGATYITIILLVVVVPYLLARFLYNKEKHHAGFDIDEKEDL